MMNDDSEDKKSKGVMKKVAKRDLTFDEYEKRALNNVSKEVSMNEIRPRKHTIFTETATKNELSANNDKRLKSTRSTRKIRHRKVLENSEVLLSDEVSWDFK